MDDLLSRQPHVVRRRSVWESAVGDDGRKARACRSPVWQAGFGPPAAPQDGWASSAALLDALRRSPQPMLIVQADLRVEWQNEAATLVAARALAVGVRDGRLVVREAPDRVRVQAAVRTACTPDGGDGKTDNRILVSDPALAWPLRLLVVPLAGPVLTSPALTGPALTGSSSSVPPLPDNDPPGGRALVFIEAAALALPSVEQLRLMFELTPVEAAIALDLLRGAAPAEIAASRRVSLNTVRTHVRRVLEKSASSRIPEFLAKIIGSP